MIVIIRHKIINNNVNTSIYTSSYFEILITFDKLLWGCLMSIIQDFGNSWDNLTISYNNTGIVCEVKGTLSVDNKG